MNFTRIIFTLLFFGVLLPVQAQAITPEKSKKKIPNWRYRQTMALMSHKNEAAPIHFRQLHQLFPTRTINKAKQGFPLKKAEKTIATSDINYRYQGQTSSVDSFIKKTRVTSLLVLKNGELATEQYFHGASAKDKFVLFSTTKSVISLLVGIAVDNNLIDINQTITHYLPELSKSGFQGATVKNVLQMTTALHFPGKNISIGGQGRDIRSVAVKSFADGNGKLRQYPETTQTIADINHGDRFQYINTNTQVLGLLIERVTGMTISQYLQEKLWQKLGTEADAHFLVDNNLQPDAIEHAWMGLIAQPRDLVRLGLMLLQQGKFNEQQLVSTAWLTQATKTNSKAVRGIGANGAVSYGFQWWLPSDEQGDFTSVGFGGQYIYVNPKKQTVIVMTSANKQYTTDSKAEAIQVLRALSNEHG